MKQHLVRMRNPLTLVSLLIGIGVYYLFTDFAAPSRNVIRHVGRMIWTEQFSFYSGNTKGQYFRIGYFAEKSTADANPRIKNVPSEGATKNLLKVASSTKSLGLIQEDTVSSSLMLDSMINEHTRMVAPLYQEKLHILYWPISEIVSSGDKTNDTTITLRKQALPVNASEYSDAEEWDEASQTDASVYLSNPRITLNLGTPNSGSLLLSHALLDSCGVVGFESRETNHPLSTALDLFDDKKIHVVFFMSGAPLASFTERLNQGARLMAVRGVNLARSLHDDFGFVLRPSHFSDDYGRSHNVATLSTRAVLVTSEDVSNSSLRSTLELIQLELQKLEEAPATAGQDGASILPFDSDDLDDPIAIVTSLEERERDQRVRDVLIFLFTVSTSFLAVRVFLVQIVPNVKKKFYFRKLTLLEHEILKESGNSNQTNAKKARLKEISFKIDSTHADILTDYETGGISEDAVVFLKQCIEDAQILVSQTNPAS